ncbi:MAG: hypothetical protein Q7S98_05740 [Deltaproteobacteria bacterium]|nr:hypothetical protein [Deltaproteobacteria bacterium]
MRFSKKSIQSASKGGGMGKIFQPLQDLIGSVYDLLHDAAEKVWSLAKPIAMIGLLVDFLTGKLGWISSMLGYYKQFLADTSGTSWLVLVLAVLLAMSCMANCKK